MNILIITQTINERDPILGFFVSWLKEFAKYYNKITVICLQKEECHLPENIKVYSLGKEAGVSRVKYLKNFFKYIWHFRKDYDSVFVHMNAEYVLLGGLFWRAFGKKIILWRNHKSGSWKTTLAGRLADIVCYTSEGSYTASFKNAVKMPVGIDTEFFNLNKKVERIPNTFLYVGRISPIKNINQMIEAFIILHKNHPEINFNFTLVGPVTSTLDSDYKKMLLDKISEGHLEDKIIFKPAVLQSELPSLYSQFYFCINLTKSGSFDKTIIESVTSGCIPLVHNTSFINEIPDSIKDCVSVPSLHPKDVAEIFFNAASSADCKNDELKVVVENHSLRSLMKKLVEII